MQIDMPNRNLVCGLADIEVGPDGGEFSTEEFRKFIAWDDEGMATAYYGRAEFPIYPCAVSFDGDVEVNYSEFACPIVARLIGSGHDPLAVSWRMFKPGSPLIFQLKSILDGPATFSINLYGHAEDGFADRFAGERMELC